MDTSTAGSGVERAEAILVVDDDVQVLRFLARMLGTLGYRHVLQANTTEEALSIFNQNAEQISLVISDFVMPTCTGDRLLLKMRAAKPTVRTLLISGNDPGSLESAIPLEPGVNFLQKPFTVNDIRQTVETLSLSA
jgi:DNA-binding NtrC family response regulator